MNIQTVFFYLASIYMLLGIVVSISFIVIMIYAVKLLIEVKKSIEENLEVVKSAVHDVEDMVDKVKNHPLRFSQGTGKFIAEVVLFGMRNLIRRV